MEPGVDVAERRGRLTGWVSTGSYCFMRLSPCKARRLAAALLTWAHAAEGDTPRDARGRRLKTHGLRDDGHTFCGRRVGESLPSERVVVSDPSCDACNEYLKTPQGKGPIE